MPLLMSQLSIVSKGIMEKTRIRWTDHCVLAALVLIMLAIGAVHLSENEFARSAYEASCLLLAQVV
jgi:hypothetical protein